MNTNGFMTLIVILILNLTNTLQAQTYTLKFKTNYGKFEAILYDFTPNHRELILKEIENKTYKKALFNRVIKNFVIQGGELDESILKRESENPTLEKIRLDPEFNAKAFHKVGALGAGRDDNPTKGSFINQIYVVVGRKVTAIELQNIEEKTGTKFTEDQKSTYLRSGGLPRLDNDYTIFGEITKGLNIAMKISEVDTNNENLPEEPVIFSIKVKKNKLK